MATGFWSLSSHLPLASRMCVSFLWRFTSWYNILGNITDSFLHPLAFQAKTLNDSTTRASSGDPECSLKCRLRL
ncbi:hypothetical protein GQ55_8G037600 [Panicum hallii var. hallii]|uniref:Secreted protein n=1 Tax=Panicum hallii var. hallii TaxID=1504633 RepID=A0A2T7CKE8_9POAL|nr:hypothetical protein GQ55_8G037600 [Panicum hallii var. hallii]